jgi:AcrR family transcriptional regulator
LVKRQPRLLGRPLSGDSEETRRQHVRRGARRCFATYGYAATSNHLIAEETGLSAAAVYHHFGRKKDLMVAVYEATFAENYELMQAATRKATSLVDKLLSILDVVHQSLAEDPARQRSCSSYATRLATTKSSPSWPTTGYSLLYLRGSDLAVNDGELLPEDAIHLRGALQAITFGLARRGNDTSVATHKIATEGCKQLIAASLHTSADNPS